MPQVPFLCCPPSPRNGLPAPMPDANRDPYIPVEPGLACSNPVFVEACDKDVTLAGTDCDGNAKTVTGVRGEVVQVVQEPGQVLNVRFCEQQTDAETVILCDPSNDHQIAFQYDMKAVPPVLLSAFDLMTGQPFTGDPDTLTTCGGSSVTEESDPHPMCDNGVNFIRWYVMRQGVPTGVTYDTDSRGMPYAVMDEAVVTLGTCVVQTACVPTIASAGGDAIASLPPGRVIGVQNPNGVRVEVLTSAGLFIVVAGVTSFSTSDFGCEVTVEAVTVSEGAVSDVIITTQSW